MDSDEYEILSNDTHNIGLIVCLAEFDAEGKPGRVTPVADCIDDGHGRKLFSLKEPEQPPAAYRHIANILRDIADHCDEDADEQEGNR